FLVGEQVREAGRTTSLIILEPAGRNTAPAVTLAALALRERAKNPLLLVMPADHVIRNNAAFHAAVGRAVPLAAEGRMVTFGIVPTEPATGYGYIKKGAGTAVSEFVEKPDPKTAERYFKSGNYLWNSGMFLMRADVWLAELEQHAPEMLAQCQKAFSGGRQDGEFYRVENEAFKQSPSDSIDYAVMEKTERAAVVPLDAG